MMRTFAGVALVAICGFALPFIVPWYSTQWALSRERFVSAELGEARAVTRCAQNLRGAKSVLTIDTWGELSVRVPATNASVVGVCRERMHGTGVIVSIGGR